MIRIPRFSRRSADTPSPEPEPEPPVLTDDEVVNPHEPFLARFSRRKLEAREMASPDEVQPTASDALVEEIPELTDADMPPIESLDFDSDFTGFMSPKVSETLRRQALKKLFLSPEFNIVDGLDEYAEDYTTFEALGDIVTADMKHQLEMEAKRKAEEARKALADAESADAESADEENASEGEPPGAQRADSTEADSTEADSREVARTDSVDTDDVEEDWEDDSEDV